MAEQLQTTHPAPKNFLATVKKIFLVGNPNVGKSVIFGRLSNKYVNVSNYPGTTVTVTKGMVELPNMPASIIDTPGMNNLFPNSEEEVVTRNILLSSEECDRVIQVIDTKNLKRGLFLTIQLSELGSCAMVALNMWDEAVLRGYEVDIKKLEDVFGVPFIPTVAIHNKGVGELKRQECRHFRHLVKYHREIERGIERLSELMPEMGVSNRSLCLLALSGDETFIEYMRKKLPQNVIDQINEIRESTERALNTNLRLAIDNTRMAEAERIAKQVLKQQKKPKYQKLWGGLEKISTHRFGGFVLLGAVLFLMYKFVGELGAGTLVDLLETKFFNERLNPAIIRIFDGAMPFPHTHAAEDGVLLAEYTRQGSMTILQEVFRFIHDFFVGEYGAITMALTYGFAIIFPVVLTFFLAFGLLEDLGYLPRLSILLNKMFKVMGLNGKAVLPMVLGLGCDTMATVTARILDTRKERIIVTFLLALAVPCSAQLAVILFLLQGGVGFKGVLIWSSIVFLVLITAGMLSSMLVKGEHNPLILEIPPLRLPLLRNIVFKTLARVEWYLKEVIPIFIIGTAMLFLLNELNLLGIIERFLRPLVVDVLRLPAEGAEAILMGFFRRDYGAAGFIRMYEDGSLSKAQILVGVTTITLFVPCIANALVMVKERGMKMAFWMFAIVVITAFGVGGLLSRGLQWVSL